MSELRAMTESQAREVIRRIRNKNNHLPRTRFQCDGTSIPTGIQTCIKELHLRHVAIVRVLDEGYYVAQSCVHGAGLGLFTMFARNLGDTIPEIDEHIQSAPYRIDPNVNEDHRVIRRRVEPYCEIYCPRSGEDSQEY